MSTMEGSRPVIEFQEQNGALGIYVCEDELNPAENSIFLELDKEQLFELIGGLLRIQSKLKI